MSHPHSRLGSHFVPLALPVQTAQVPDPPHAVGWSPATQELPEQQNPPLHVPSPVAPQDVVHEPPAVHVGVPAVHGEHVWPFAPHAPFAVPVTHVPALQQPPLHPVWFVPRHALPQVCAFVSQA